ncbi:MAG: SDR family oxidoreductase [Trueperaceae bacterium]|nr:SDR family oxidoreductase [Trueperaceae bacterium]
MNILIIGGTRFVGRHLVETALAKGHTLTLFNRGSHKEVFPELEHIQGDRNKPEDLAKLGGMSWDAVIDTCAYFPRQVRSLLEVLGETCGHYTLISSISVYRHQDIPLQDEEGELAKLEDETVEEVTGETYGGLKVLCEQAATELMADRVLVPRPGLIVGPFDTTDRFSYWPHRIAQGGEVMAPHRPEKALQFIDVRDLASWTVAAAERKLAGAFNMVIAPDKHGFGDLLETCKQVSGSDASFTWVDETFLLEHEVAPWMGLPIWVPADLEAFLRTSNQKALAEGLTTRSLKDTVKDTLVWLKSRDPEHQWQAGISREKEQEVLTRWHQRK